MFDCPENLRKKKDFLSSGFLEIWDLVAKKIEERKKEFWVIGFCCFSLIARKIEENENGFLIYGLLLFWSLEK